MGERRGRLHRVETGVERAQPHGVSQMLNRRFGLSAECLEQAAELPRGGEMRIERKRPFDQVSAFLRFEHYPRESVPGP